MKLFFLLYLVLAVLTGCSDDAALKIRAEKFSKENIIVDTHIDVPYRLHANDDDISGVTTGNFDYPKAAAGGLDVAFFAVYIPPETEAQGTALTTADTLIKLVLNTVQRWPDKFTLVTSPAAVRQEALHGKVLLAMGLENGSALAGDINNIGYLFGQGIRYITLCHSKSNIICDSSYDPDHQWNGLSPFGREVVPAMNRVGMMIDVSHVSDSAFYEVLSLSKAPVIASHSACRSFTPGLERNLSDQMIRDLAENGGVIQINFGSSFINDAYRKNFDPMWKYLEDNYMKHGDPATEEYMKRFREEHPIDFANVSDVADHIDHVVYLVGIEHVGLGSDFDGLGDSLPNGLKDVSGYPNLIFELLRRGYSEEEVQKICSENILRVWSEVQLLAEQP